MSAMKCDTCNKDIRIKSIYVSMHVDELDGKSLDKKYCDKCSIDSELKLAFEDIIRKPIIRVLIERLWHV